MSYPRLLGMLALTRFRSISGETEFELIKPSMRRLASSFLLRSVTSDSFSLQYDEWMKPNPALRRRPGERRRSTISFLQSHGCAVVHARRRSQDGSVPTARAKARFNRTASARAVISSPIGISLHRRGRRTNRRGRSRTTRNCRICSSPPSSPTPSPLPLLSPFPLCTVLPHSSRRLKRCPSSLSNLQLGIAQERKREQRGVGCCVCRYVLFLGVAL